LRPLGDLLQNPDTGAKEMVDLSAQDDIDRTPIHQGMERALTTFHQLLDEATEADLRHRTDGTRWTNEQLLFHMLFGYLIVRTLLPLVRIFGRLPEGAGRLLAGLLNSAASPFNAVNYLGSCTGAKVFNRARMGPKMDRTISSLHRRLQGETDEGLRRAMRFPSRWDPYFKDTMTLAEVYQYATEHFDHHQRQLTLREPGGNH
jgi:hypothetical protein